MPSPSASVVPASGSTGLTSVNQADSARTSGAGSNGDSAPKVLDDAGAFPDSANAASG